MSSSNVRYPRGLAYFDSVSIDKEVDYSGQVRQGAVLDSVSIDNEVDHDGSAVVNEAVRH